jgi:two-component system, NarL family, nitrate/nitrite response regulator NarL
LRLLVIASDPLARAGLSGLAGALPGIQVVAQAEANTQIRHAFEAYSPQVCLWDLGWSSGETWSFVIEAANGTSAGIPIVALAADAEQAGRAWRSGLRSVLTRTAPEESLAHALSAASLGLWVLDPDLFERAIPIRIEAAGAADEPLTVRETEVLSLLAQGLANKEIARRLNITEHTVKFHINSIMGKLGVQSRTEAVVRATRLGLVML